MTLKRFVRWDARSENNPVKHNYLFVIVGDERQANKIRQKFLEMAQPTDDDNFLAQGVISKSKIKYSILEVTSYSMSPTNFEAEQKKLYRRDIKRNRDISARQNNSSLIRQVENSLAKGEMPFGR